MLKKIRVVLTSVLMVIMLLSMAVPVLSENVSIDNASEKYQGLKGHWAQKQIESWQANGLVTGYADGTFKPDIDITRAEFITLVNSAFGFTQKANQSFTDVSSSDWFAGEFAKAKALGYLNGYANGTVKPNNKISRQEVAVILYKILKLDSSKYGSVTGKFIDASNIPVWSKNKINSVVSIGYMGGYPDQTYHPERSISRAEVIATLYKVVGTLYNSAGSFGPANGVQTVDGNVTISKSDVTLKNTEIKGNLYLTEGIGTGNVTLENVTVKGTTTVSGGGINSIIIINSSLGQVVINVPDGSKVRLVASGTTNIGEVDAQSNAKLEEDNLTGTGFTDVIVEVPAGADVELQGDFGKVQVESPNTKVNVTEGTISSLTVSEAATGSDVNLAVGATVTTLTLDTATEVTGQGTIGTANINVSGSIIEQTPTTTNVAPETTGNVGGKPVSETTGSNTGGGGGGGGGSQTVDANLAAAKAAESALTSTNYVDYSAVTAALAMAEGTDAEKIAKTTAINDAITGLVLKADLTAYNAALAAVTEATYTPASWATYQGIVTANVVTVENTQAAVDAATGNITTAQGALVLKLAIATAAIAGVTAPVNGATPVSTIADTTEYTATIAWSGTPTTFAGSTEYTATITITPKTGYTLTGVGADFFTVAEATTVTNAVYSGIVTAVFPATAADSVAIATATIAGVTVPVTGATPVATIAATTEYTATITWNGTPTTFAASTAYQATITIIPKTGYTLTGVGADFFTVAGATATNAADSGIVTAEFPATAAPATKSLKTFTPVTLTQTGDVANSNVQYANAAVVIAALPTTITVTLEDDTTTAVVPVTWANTGTAYDAATAADYTFTATWGAMPAGADNADTIAAPTVDVTVAAGVLATKSLKTFTPVTLTVSGSVYAGNVQYATATNVAAALPSTITVTLEDDTTTAVVPVTWANTGTAYDAATAADYTFTATWGAMPAGANNDSSLAVPTVEVTVASAPTANVTFALTIPAEDEDNTITTVQTPYSKKVTVRVVNGTPSVVITGTKTTDQTVKVDPFEGSNDHLSVTKGGTPTAPTYTVNTIAGNKIFTLTVTEPGKSKIVYLVEVKVAPTAITAATIAIAAPVIGATPATTIEAETGYTGGITWTIPSTGVFVTGTAPAATVVLTADKGYTFTGMVTTGAVTIVGSTSATYVVSGTNDETLTITVGYAAL